jgi:hypothetical protein
MIAPPFNPDEQQPRKPSPVERLSDGILNLIAIHMEEDDLEDGECHAAIIMAVKGLPDRLLLEALAEMPVAPRTGQWTDPALSA